MRKVNINSFLVFVWLLLSMVLISDYIENNSVTWYQQIEIGHTAKYFRNKDMIPVQDKEVLKKLDAIPEELLFEGVIVNFEEKI